MKVFRDFILFNRDTEVECPTISWNEHNAPAQDTVPFLLNEEGCRTLSRAESNNTTAKMFPNNTIAYGSFSTAKIFLHIVREVDYETFFTTVLFKELLQVYYCFYSVKPRVVWDSLFFAELKEVV